MAAFDPEIAKGIQARDGRRLHAAREILRRAGLMDTKKTVKARNSAAEVLSMLTSFETYDALARAGQTEEQILATITDLARHISGL